MTVQHETRAPFAAQTTKTDKRSAGRTEASETLLELRGMDGELNEQLRDWVYERVSFRFERPQRGMQRLSLGDLIGHGDHLTVSVRNPCYAVMPNDDVPVGDDMLYIAEDLEPAE